MERNHSSERAFDKPHLIYFMHSAFSLLSQMWNFGIALFIASISNNSLFIIALTGFIQNLSIVLLLPVIGKWVDRTDRLVAVHTALFVKVVFITLGFSICAFLPSSGNSYMADSNVTDGDDKDIVDSNFYLYVVCLPIIVAAASLGFYTYRLCIEKDWVIELANRDSEWLANANSVMSQIDLACKSFAPAATGALFLVFSSPVVAGILLVTNFIASALLYCFFNDLYFSWPSLSKPKMIQLPLESSSRESNADDSNNTDSYDLLYAIRLFYNQKCSGVMVAFSFLFMTVLSFDTIMTVYLLFMGMEEVYVGIARGISAFIGFLGASIYPFCREKFGLWNSGTIALIWQVFFVGVAASSFFMSSVYYSLLILTASVLTSRIGLWLFDLSSRQICQESIDESVRGSVNGTWQSLVNIFELSVYALTMIFSKPQQFYILSFVSFFFVFGALVVFTLSRNTFFSGEKPSLVIELEESIPIAASTDTKSKYMQNR